MKSNIYFLSPNKTIQGFYLSYNFKNPFSRHLSALFSFTMESGHLKPKRSKKIRYDEVIKLSEDSTGDQHRDLGILSERQW